MGVIHPTLSLILLQKFQHVVRFASRLGFGRPRRRLLRQQDYESRFVVLVEVSPLNQLLRVYIP